MYQVVLVETKCHSDHWRHWNIWHLQHFASWLFNSPSFLFTLHRFERWHSSQVCALSLAEIIAFVFRQAPFPSKGIVSTRWEERIMVSHLVPHPRSFSCTYKHIQTHAPILRRKDGRTRAKLSKHIHFGWLRSWTPSTSDACAGNPLLRPSFLRPPPSVKTANSRSSSIGCSAHTTWLLNFWTLDGVSASKERVECCSLDVQNNPERHVGDLRLVSQVGDLRQEFILSCIYRPYNQVIQVLSLFRNWKAWDKMQNHSYITDIEKKSLTFPFHGQD